MRRALGIATTLAAVWGCAVSGPGAISGPAPEAVVDDARATVNCAGRPVLTYRHGDAPFKPYVKTLHTPGGAQILRDSPSDHVHHRGLMFALALDGKDFWSEAKTSGRQVPTGKIGTRSIPGGIALIQNLDWIPAGTDRSLARESRRIGIHGVVANATLITWTTRLRPADGVKSVAVTGSHYQGLGMRFVSSMDKTDAFRHATGKPGPVVRGSERVTPSAWTAFTATADGKPVTVALFDHPSNPRAPAGMFSMVRPFSYLAATPNVWKRPLAVKAGESLLLRYGVAVWDGDPGTEAVAKLQHMWAGMASSDGPR